MDRLLRKDSDATDRFFRVVGAGTDGAPVLQYFWFDGKGWLYGLLKVFPSGEAEVETATPSFPLSYGQLNLDEFEADWPDGAASVCSVDEYFAVDALIGRADKKQS